MHEAAAAATALAAGDRKVELTIDGPVEVADISNALNLLATNLANSEDRQREFLMSISHELRTPLTSLKGYSEALADGMINADENADVGKLMMGETARLERLISDLLDLARMQAVEFRLENSTINLNEIVESAAEAWRITADKAGINFEFTTLAADAADDSIIEADVTRVRQMLDNLLENAIKVVGPGGMVRLTLETRAREFVVAVEDDGPGLADSDYEVAFEPAVLHNKYKHQRSGGSGLGLALVGTLARRMGAAVTAGPSELGGAKFELQFAKSTAEISPN
jgi:two-component system sensor histidine kinase BaeS